MGENKFAGQIAIAYADELEMVLKNIEELLTEHPRVDRGIFHYQIEALKRKVGMWSEVSLLLTNGIMPKDFSEHGEKYEEWGFWEDHIEEGGEDRKGETNE